MILPLSDAPNPRGVPVVTYALLALNVLIYLVVTWPLSHQGVDLRDPALRDYLVTVRDALPMGVPLQSVLAEVSAYDLFVFKHGYRPAAPELGDLFTAMFLHGGFLHLFGNMLFLWIYGDNVEARLGRVRYLLAYLLTGGAATLFYAWFAPQSRLPLVGASGAISGVLGLYFLWFPRNTVRLFVFLFPFFMNVVQVPARWVLGFYLLVDNLLPFLLASGGSGGVAHGAHLGGFIAGLGLAWGLERREVRERPRDFAAASPRPTSNATPSVRPPRLADVVREALARGEMDGAARAYFNLAPHETRGLLTAAESLSLGEWLAGHGHPEAALTLFRRHLRDHPAGPGLAEAHLGAGLIQLEVLGQVAPAYQHFLEALEADPSAATRQRARAALEQIAARQRYAFRRFTH